MKISIAYCGELKHWWAFDPIFQYKMEVTTALLYCYCQEKSWILHPSSFFGCVWQKSTKWKHVVRMASGGFTQSKKRKNIQPNIISPPSLLTSLPPSQWESFGIKKRKKVESFFPEGGKEGSLVSNIAKRKEREKAKGIFPSIAPLPPSNVSRKRMGRRDGLVVGYLQYSPKSSNVNHYILLTAS